MSVSDRIMGLTKYMITLPKSKITMFLIFVVSFLTGAIAGCLEPGLTLESVVYTFLSGGATTFFLLGLTTIGAGALIHTAVNSLNKRHMKQKQALFVAFLGMFIICILFLIGTGLTLLLNQDYKLNTLLLGILFAFALETLVIWSTSNIRFMEGALIGAIHPILTLSMMVLINYLTQTTTGINSVISLYLKAIIGALVLAIAVYSFVSIVESPIKNNLGVGGLELLSLFIGHITEGSNAMEEVFSNMGESVDTIVSFISFKDKNDKIKLNYISPCVHPGPVGSIGGGNLPTIMAQQLHDPSIIAHGAATHDLNPVASKEIIKITEAVENELPNLTYGNTASEFIRVQSEEAKIGAQFFNDGAVILSTFAPNPADDIDYGVGLSMIYQTKYKTGAKNVVLVDCHNCLKGNEERLMPGHNRVKQIEETIDKLEVLEQYPIRMGWAYDPIDDIEIKDGIGESGVKIMITEVNGQHMLYIVFDGNNMLQGYREEIFEAVHDEYPQIDMIEVMTTDTHMVNTISGGGLTVGTKHGELLIQHVLNLIHDAIEDMEEVSVASATARVNIKTFGPNNSTELVTTISSIVSVSKLLAPLIFIFAIIITIWWVF
jgi:putative membrane protein